MSENIQATLLRTQFGDLISNIPDAKITQRPIYKGSKAPKYTTDDIKNLAQLIIQKQRGIGYDRKLITKAGAEKFIQQRKLENRLRAVTGDFDDDPITPDNVVIVDNKNIPKYIDGYSIIPSTKRISELTTTQTDKAVLKAYGKSDDTRFYKKWMRKYLTEAERRAHPYDEWKASELAKNPNFGQPSDYSKFYKIMSDKLKAVLAEKGIQIRDLNYIGLLAALIKEMLYWYKQQIELQPRQKLRTEDYAILTQVDIRALEGLNRKIQEFTKNKQRENPESFNLDEYKAFRFLPEDVVVTKRGPVERKKRTIKPKLEEEKPQTVTRAKKRRVIIHDDDDDSEEEVNVEKEKEVTEEFDMNEFIKELSE